MSITDELRNWMENAFTYKSADGDMFHKVSTPWFGWKQDIEEMLDRIDAEHEGACAEAYGNGVMSVPIAIDESQWVKLPVDADGVPIHVGDVMEWCDPDGEVTVTCEVDAVGVECFFAWDGANGRYAQKCANVYRHHHPPTVEDVLREFAEKVTDSQIPGVHPTYEEAIAEYAAKLRLRGEDE